MRFSFLLVFLAILLGFPPSAAADSPRLNHFYDDWATAARPLMSETEATAFGELTSDVDRELFLRAFWEARGDSESAALWAERFREAERRFEQVVGDRPRAMLAAGIPDRIFAYGGCRGTIRPLRIWWYNRWQASRLAGESRDGFYLVFARDYESADGLFRGWSPSSGIGALAENNAPGSRRTIEQVIAYSRDRKCFRTGEDEAKTLRSALTHALELSTLEGWIQRDVPDPSWIEAFWQELAGGRLALPASRVAVGFPGRDGRKTVMLGRLDLPVKAIRRGAAGQLFDRLVLRGEVMLGRHVSDRFEIVYHLAGKAPKTDVVQLDFYRRLRPASYLLRLRLEDDRGLGLLRQDLTLKVPASDHDLGEGAKRNMSEVTKREVVTLLTFPSVEIVPPGEALVGEVPVEAVTHGGPVARVDFLLDGEPAGSDGDSPFETTVDLGALPAVHRLEAVAFSPRGEELSRDVLRLDPAERPFSVRLTSPRPARPIAVRAGEGGNEEVAADVFVPADHRLARVELYLDDALLAFFDGNGDGPFRAPLPPLGPDDRFLRAVAILESGERTEDLLAVGSQLLESMNVRWVEVFAGVENADGRPVTGLGAEDFRILEDGEPQELARFSTVADLPIQVVLAMDTSVSMRERLDFAVDSARRFFAGVLTPKDRAALVTFHHDIRLAVPFTHDVDRLRLGSSGLSAWGGTRLHDTLAYTAGYFGGHSGRRALVLLSDGRDVESDFDFDSAMDQVLRAGVAVYPILLSVADEGTREQLGRLAKASGGRAFSLRSVAGLDAAYAQIEEELRSQYLLVYAAPEGKGRTAFRRLEVEVVERPGLRARSIRGYYP